VGSGGIQRTESKTKRQAVSWATVVAGETTPQQEVPGPTVMGNVKHEPALVTRDFPRSLEGQTPVVQAAQGADMGVAAAVRGVTPSTQDANVAGSPETDAPPDITKRAGACEPAGQWGDLWGEPSAKRQRESEQPNISGGELPLNLPGNILFKILARIPIPELRRLLRDRVSRRFSAAIKDVLVEIAIQAAREALALDEQGAMGQDAYDQAEKARLVHSASSAYPRRFDEAYAGRDCC
jgi:hypothetical protein